MLNNSNIIAALARGVDIFYRAMMDRLNSGNYPKGDSNREPPTTSIQEATSVSPPRVEDDSIKMSIVIDLNKAPYAAAFEWGRGTPYTITPKPGTAALIFPKERWPQYEPPPPAPIFFFFPEVEHKEIVAKPYIKPTLDDKKSEVVRAIGREVVLSIKSRLHEITETIK